MYNIRRHFNIWLLFLLLPLLIYVMAVALSSIRAPQFLSRSWTVTPSYINHRAGKASRKDTALAYRVFLDLHQNIRRSLSPYKMQTKSFSSTSRTASGRAASAIPHISLHIAASSSGKGQKWQPESSTYDYEMSNTQALGLQRGDSLQEKRRNRPDSGQDAYFVARVGQDQPVTAFGIADGVGGWTEHGIDPADLSHGLCSHMAAAALEWTGAKLGPRQLLEIGYNKSVKDPDIIAGGTTACVAVTDEDGRMRVANLGDSGFLQLRLGTVHSYSEPQTHAFNTPFQMSITPPEILRQARMFGGAPLSDKPERADIAEHMLKHGDVLVLATDGVWDNLDAQDILKIVTKVMRDSGAWQRSAEQGYAVADKIGALTNRGEAQNHNLPGTLQSVLAAAIAGEAKVTSMDRKRDGPFAKAVHKEYPSDSWHGGKVDDIAVLVVVPVENSKVGPIKAKL